MDNLKKQQSNLVNLFEPSMWVLANFYGTEQVNEFQGKESKVDVIIDKEEVIKELLNFLLDSKDAFQCHNKKTNHAAAEVKEKLTKEKKSADKIKKMVEHSLMQILLPFLFGVTSWLISMKQKPFIPT